MELLGHPADVFPPAGTRHPHLPRRPSSYGQPARSTRSEPAAAVRRPVRPVRLAVLLSCTLSGRKRHARDPPQGRPGDPRGRHNPDRSARKQPETVSSWASSLRRTSASCAKKCCWPRRTPRGVNRCAARCARPLGAPICGRLAASLTDAPALLSPRPCIGRQPASAPAGACLHHCRRAATPEICRQQSARLPASVDIRSPRLAGHTCMGLWYWEVASAALAV